MKFWGYLAMGAALLLIYWLYYRRAANLASTREAENVLIPASPEIVPGELGLEPGSDF